MKKFIALVLSLVMALSLCVPAWGADPADVSTFEQLKTAITGGATEINLTGSITVNEDYPLTGVTITVAESVTSAGNDAIIVSNNATLTLGAGTTITGYSALLLAYGGNIEIGAGATVEATGATSNGKIFPAVLAYTGTVTVNGGTITSSDNALVATTSQGKAVIEAGSTVTGGAGKVAAYSYGGGSITMNGGTVNGSLTAASSGNTVVNDGKVNGNVAAYGDASASVEIEGGEVSGTVYENDGATASVTGGTFATDVSEFVEDTIAVATVNGDYIVGADAIEEAATVGATVDVVQGTVTLGDKTLGVDDEPYEVPAPAPTTYTVTFDANGGTGTMATATDLTAGTEYTLPACTFTAPADKEFDAWSVGGVNKAVGEKITITGNVEVTALWKDKAPAGGDNDNGGDEGGNTGTITPPSNWWPIGGIATEDKPIESPETFDAGIALYVGMSVAAAVGTVTLSKKRED